MRMKLLIGQRMTMQFLFDPLRLVSFDPFRLGGGKGGTKNRYLGQYPGLKKVAELGKL